MDESQVEADFKARKSDSRSQSELDQSSAIDKDYQMQDDEVILKPKHQFVYGNHRDEKSPSNMMVVDFIKFDNLPRNRTKSMQEVKDVVSKQTDV